MTDHLITADELRQICDPAYDYVRDEHGYVRIPGSLYDAIREAAGAGADQLDLYELEAKRRAA